MTPRELAQRMSEEPERIARYFFPNGKREGQEWRVGSLEGEVGKSLGICLSGNKSGVWSDFATGESGDLLDLWMRIQSCSLSHAMKEAKDFMLVDVLENRFLAVGFMTVAEVVGAGIIKMEEVDKLCQNAFLWKEGPFAIMNKIGICEVMKIVTERMELSHRKAINFPIPKLLISQSQKNEPWYI